MLFLYARRSLIRCSNDLVTRNFLGALSMSFYYTTATAIAQDFPFAFAYLPHYAVDKRMAAPTFSSESSSSSS